MPAQSCKPRYNRQAFRLRHFRVDGRFTKASFRTCQGHARLMTLTAYPPLRRHRSFAQAQAEPKGPGARRGAKLLGIDRPRAKRQQVEPATDPAVSPLQRRDSIQRLYAWVARTLRQHGYSRQNRAAKGLLRQYLVKMTGLSRAQITRLIQQYRQGGELQPARYRRHRFARKYTPADVELLAAVDEAHETLSGPAKDPRAGIPAVPAARIRAAGGDLGGPDLSPAAAHYRQRRLHFTKTRPTAVSIAVRCITSGQG